MRIEHHFFAARFGLGIKIVFPAHAIIRHRLDFREAGGAIPIRRVAPGFVIAPFIDEHRILPVKRVRIPDAPDRHEIRVALQRLLEHGVERWARRNGFAGDFDALERIGKRSGRVKSDLDFGFHDIAVAVRNFLSFAESLLFGQVSGLNRDKADRKHERQRDNRTEIQQHFCAKAQIFHKASFVLFIVNVVNAIIFVPSRERRATARLYGILG